MRAFLVIKQLKQGLRIHFLTRLPAVRHIKTDAAAEQCGERTDLYTYPLRGHVKGNTAVLPEAGVGGHQFVIRCVDKELILHLALIKIKFCRFHGTDTVTTEQHSIPRIQLSGLLTG